MRLGEALADMTSEVQTLVGNAVFVTVDAIEATNAVAAGSIALVILPPEITFETPLIWSHTWKLWLLSPEQISAPALTGLGEVIDKLQPLGMTSAEPFDFESTHSRYPGYQLTLSDVRS